jgi:sigma54-dependent transcription regulator
MSKPVRKFMTINVWAGSMETIILTEPTDIELNVDASVGAQVTGAGGQVRFHTNRYEATLDRNVTHRFSNPAETITVSGIPLVANEDGTLVV